MLILNPICGGLMIVSIALYPWYLFIPFITLLALVVMLNFKFYFYTHKEESKEYDAWHEKFSIEHELLGFDYYCQFWRNKATGEIIEIY